MPRDIIYISLFTAAALFLCLKREYQRNAGSRKNKDRISKSRGAAVSDILIPVCGALIIIIGDIIIYGPWFSTDIQAQSLINGLKLYIAETALFVYTVFKVWEQLRKKQE